MEIELMYYLFFSVASFFVLYAGMYFSNGFEINELCPVCFIIKHNGAVKFHSLQKGEILFSYLPKWTCIVTGQCALV